MTGHADYDKLIALRMGTLGGDESRELLNHVAGCAMCRRAAQEVLDVRAEAREVVASLAREERPRRSRARWLAAAAILVIAVTVPLLLRRNDPAPVPPPVAATAVAAPSPSPAPPPPAVPARPAPWEAIASEAVAAGAIAPPALLLSLQPAPDEFRARSAGHETIPDMQPFGEIVESDRPLFRWPKTDGATYTVIVGERGRVVAQSGSLEDNSWRCAVPLARGRSYRWQVEIRKGDQTSMMPMPPAPNARFHVLGAAAKAQLDEVRQAAPGDHLVLGILSARAGLREQALGHLDAVSGDEAKHARALADSIRKWPAARR
jgi:hypothetical protein